MKDHIKRINTPRTWSILRKANKFITRPSPGAHPHELSLPMNIILKKLNYAKTTKEAKIILDKKEVLKDGKKVKNHKLPIGFMDVISFKDIKKYFRIILNPKGKLDIIEIPEKEANLKPCKIINKTMIKNGKLQLNLMDAKNIIVDKNKYQTGDTILIELPSQKIIDHFKLDEKSTIILTGGKHIGKIGTINKIENNKLIFKDDQEYETLKKYAFVIGKDKSSITLK